MKPTIVNIENATLKYRNFSGKEGTFNRKGDRNFNVFLSDEDADTMTSMGYNVKCLIPIDEGDSTQCRIAVKVNFSNKPPKIVLITSSGQTYLTEADVNILDFADIENADLVVTPYEWDFNGKSGTTAYLKALYVTIREDAFEKKYINIPDSAENVIGLGLDDDDETY